VGKASRAKTANRLFNVVYEAAAKMEPEDRDTLDAASRAALLTAIDKHRRTCANCRRKATSWLPYPQ
jgi:hypothetical protein